VLDQRLTCDRLAVVTTAPSSASSRPDATFQSTLWSQVQAAGRPEAPDAQQSFDALCRAYWPPIYAFLRRCGCPHQDAQDLTQGFFVYMMEEGLLAKARQERGRFRSFLLGSLKCFVSNERAKARALKRGGGIAPLPLDSLTAAGLEPAASLTPEQCFDQRWALLVIGEAMKRLEAEYHRGGMGDQFTALQPYLTGDADGHLSDLAVQLGKSHGATRILVFRLRNRFRRLVRAVIADTVADVDQVESELRELEVALRAE